MAFFEFKHITKLILLLYCVRGGNSEITEHAPVTIIPTNFTQMAHEAGLPCEEVRVTTEDGYILTIFHVPGDPNHPVLLQSGNLGTSDDYMIRGNTSLIYVLWQAGYDTWVGNVRGCRYSRKHVSLNPDTDDKFWEFSIHEFAVYDTPAMVDYILDRTGALTLSSIGWSCGSQVNYILGAERPEYNDKIDVVISLAPIGYLHHSESFNSLKPFKPLFDDSLILADVNEVLGENSTALSAIRMLCSTQKTAKVCLEAIFPFVGYDMEQVNDVVIKFFQHYPSSTSRQNEMHLYQILKNKKFAPYDYGLVKNMKIYGSAKPKEYDLSKNTMNIVLISGLNDQASKIGDVNLLKARLPNVIDHITLEPKTFNHLDFVCGRDTHKILYETIILDILKDYNNNFWCYK